MGKTLLYKADDLRDYIIRFFVKLGVPRPDAEIAAEVLVLADLRGVDSHGIIRKRTWGKSSPMRRPSWSSVPHQP